MEALVRRAGGPSEGLVILANLTLRAALGAGGISPEKCEGDGATPVGLLPIRQVFYRADRVARPRCALLAEPLAPDDGWCDDASHRDYNRRVHLPHPAGHEALWRDAAEYDVIGVLGWNDAPVERGRGSAIFLHVARPDYRPTAGCVALSLPDLCALLDAGMTALRVIP